MVNERGEFCPDGNNVGLSEPNTTVIGFIGCCFSFDSMEDKRGEGG